MLGEERRSTHRLKKGDLFLTSRFESLASPRVDIQIRFSRQRKTEAWEKISKLERFDSEDIGKF